MNTSQMEAARREMIGWLSHPQELGKAPSKIECAGTFELHGMTYYMFKYKKSLMGKWLLGVAGGYEDDDENCGHTFSEMTEYRAETAREDAAAIVERLRQFIMKKAEDAEKRKQNPGTFLNFILLEEPEADIQAILDDMRETWGIDHDGDPKGKEGDGSTRVVGYNGAMIALSLMPGPIPGNEAEGCAARNFMWRDGVEAVSRHKAHMVVTVMGHMGGLTPVEGGKLLVKTVCSALKQKGAIGVLANGVVYPPDYYSHFAQMAKEDLLPLFNLVWFGLYNSKGGVCGYTSGLKDFGFDEIEVIDSKAQPQEVMDFLADVAGYVITENVLLQDGETIGFSAQQKLPITKSKGAAVDGDSIKIAF